MTLTLTWSGFVPKLLLISAFSLNFSSVAWQAAPQPPSSKLPFLPVSVDLWKRQGEDGLQRDVSTPNTSVSSVPPLSPPSHTPPISPAATRTCKMEAESDKQRAEERVEQVVEEIKTNVKEEPRKMPFWLDDDDNLPPMM